MKKKGFTLIELLAVIVILVVVSLITVPMILGVINKSKEKAAKSSIELLKEGITVQMVSLNLKGEASFSLDENGCYLFDFDNKNNNYEKLNVKNKEYFTGKLWYCNDNHTEDNTGDNMRDDNFIEEDLVFNDTVKTVKKTLKLNLVNESFTSLVANDNYRWAYIYDDSNTINMGMWYASFASVDRYISGLYYNDKITVTKSKPATLSGKIATWYNCGSNATFYIGFSKQNNLSETNFDAKKELQQTFQNSSSVLSKQILEPHLQDFEVEITEPGDYYIKAIYNMHTRNCSAYSTITELNLTQ